MKSHNPMHIGPVGHVGISTLFCLFAFMKARHWARCTVTTVNQDISHLFYNVLNIHDKIMERTATVFIVIIIYCFYERYTNDNKRFINMEFSLFESTQFNWSDLYPYPCTQTVKNISCLYTFVCGVSWN